MHVRARLAFRRHPVNRAGKFAIDQKNAFVALAHLRNIALHDDRLAKEGGEHLEHRAEVLVAVLHPEHAGAAIAVERLQDDVLVIGPEGADFFPIRGDQGGGHQILEQGHEQLLGRIADVKRIVHH